MSTKLTWIDAPWKAQGNEMGNQSYGGKTAFAATALIATLGLAGSAWGAGCTDDAPTESDYTLVIDATATCANLSANMTGCRIDSGQTSCTAPNGMTATLTSGTIGGTVPVSFTTTGFQADVSLIGGATQGSSCGYFYSDGTNVATNLHFVKSNGGNAQVKYVDVCTDGQDEAPPPVTRVLPACPQDIQDALDEGTIPGDLAYVIQNISDGDSATLCIKNDPDFTETDCVNEEADSGSPFPPCNDLDRNGVPDFADGPNMTPLIEKVGENSCTKTCLPSPLTYESGSSCKQVCK